MSDISTKLTYLNTTKGKIKDVINMTGVGITNDTFRSYAQSLYNGYIATLQDKGTLLDNMNKGTSTGAISGSANLPVYEYKASKLSTQNTTTQSANLLDEEYLKTATYEITTYKSTLTNIKGNRQLYVKAQLKQGKTAISGLYVRLSSLPNPTSSRAVYGIFVSNGTPFTNTQPDFSNDDTLYFTFYPTTVNVSDIFDTYNFWVSTTDTSYTPFVPDSPSPDYPSEVKTVKGYRNLLDLTNAQSQESNGVKITVNSDKSITLYGTSTSAITYDVAISDINLSSSKTYLISQSNSYYGSRYAISLRDNSYVVVDSSCSLDSSKSNKEFTVSTDKVAKYFRIYIPNNVALDTTIYPMILEGTTIKPYVPYGSNYIYTTISDGTNSKVVKIPLNNNEVCGIGDYKDEIVIDKYGHAKLVKKIGKQTYNGSETSWIEATAIGIVYWYIAVGDALDISYTINEILSNYFKWQTQNDKDSFYLNHNNLVIFNHDIANDLSGFKAWLSTHNTDVYYPLATPTEIDLGTVDMELYEGTNNITNSEDMDMAIKYIKDTYE